MGSFKSCCQSNHTLQRLQKVISDFGLCSRRKAESYISSSCITVNNKKVDELGTKVCPLCDKICFEGKLLKPTSKHLFLFHKPCGVVTTMSDHRRRSCVGDYVKELGMRVFPLGRLDAETSGLLLLSNDGDFANKLLHPSYEIERVYWAQVKGKVDKKQISEMKKGKILDGVEVCPKSVRLLLYTSRVRELFETCDKYSTLLEISLHIGPKHVVRRFFSSYGFPVLKLCRVAFGEYGLGRLRVGEIKEVDWDFKG